MEVVPTQDMARSEAVKKFASSMVWGANRFYENAWDVYRSTPLEEEAAVWPEIIIGKPLGYGDIYVKLDSKVYAVKLEKGNGLDFQALVDIDFKGVEDFIEKEKIQDGFIFLFDKQISVIVKNGKTKEVNLPKDKLIVPVEVSKVLLEFINDPWNKGRLYAGIGLAQQDEEIVRKAIEEWKKVKGWFAYLFSSSLYRFVGEFDMAKKSLEKAKCDKEWAFYKKVEDALIQLNSKNVYLVGGVMGKTVHKVGIKRLIISPKGAEVQIWKIKRRLDPRNFEKYYEKLDELGKAKLLALAST